MSIISLLTDFGYQDNFVGVMKAVILKINPAVTLVDICHEVKPQDVQGAALLLKNSFRYFPSGTIHVVVVDPGVGSRRKKVIVKTKHYYFIAPDNGVLFPALQEEPPERITEIVRDSYFLKPVSDTFHGRDIFAPVAAYLSKGTGTNRFGKSIPGCKQLHLPVPVQKSRSLIGKVIHIDHFGNLVSSIDKDTFVCFMQNKACRIEIKGRTIRGLSHSYTEAAFGKPLAAFGSFNTLEIAVNGTSAAKTLNAGLGTKIIVKGV